MSFVLDALLYGYRKVFADTTERPNRSRVSFGPEFNLTDDAVNEWTRITVAEASAPILVNSTTGTQNDVPTISGQANASVLRHTGAAPTVTGYASGTSNRRMLVWARGGPVVLANENAGSVAANRIVTGTGANVTIPNGAAVWLVYDATTARWHLGQVMGSGAASQGAAGAVNTADGAGGWSEAANVKAGASFLSVAADPATSGLLRTAGSGVVSQWMWKDGASDRAVVQTSTGGGWMRFGPGNSYNAEVHGIRCKLLKGDGTEMFDIGGTSGDFITVGDLPATAGHMRVKNGFLFKARNAANSANFTLMEIDGSNFLWIGSKSDDTEKVQALRFNPVASTTFLVNGSTKLIIDASIVQHADGIPLVLGQNGVAVAGDLRMRNQRVAAGRNAGDTADVRLFTVDASDRVVLGENAASRTYIVLGTDCQFTCNNGEMIINNFTTQPIYVQHGSSGLVQRRAAGEEYGRWLSADVQTTDATITTLLSGTVGTNTAYTIEAYVTAQATDNTTANGYMRIATVRDSGGILNLIGAVSTPHTAEADAALDVTIDTNANDWRVRVTGKAALTVDWRCMVRIMKAA